MAISVADVTKAGFVSDAGPIETYQGGTFPGKLVLTASRLSGVSPCAIKVSAHLTTRNGYDKHQVIGCGGTTNIGYHYNFGDPNSGTFNTFYESSKNTSPGAWAATHTYQLDDGDGAVTFTIMCTAKDAAGNEATTSLDVVVTDQLTHFGNTSDTIAISNTKTPGNWHLAGDTRNPPSNYSEHASIASAFALLRVDDAVGKRVLFHRGDDFSAEAGVLQLLTGNNNCMFSWFGPELTGNVATETGTDVSFTAPTTTDQNNGIGGYINHPAGFLSSMTAKAEITISGAAGNNHKWVLRSIGSTQSTVRFNTGRIMTTEVANNAAVITEHTLRPIVPSPMVGVSSSGSQSMNVQDADLSAAATAFTNDGWCEDVYFDGLRVPSIALPISGQQLTFHNLDLDWEDEPDDGNTNFGKISMGNGSYSWVNPTLLDPDSVVFPKGLYLSECIVIGSTARIAAAQQPTQNIAGANFPYPIWFGVVGCAFRAASEMNLRIQGGQLFNVQDTDFLGQHIGGQSNKARYAMRGAGANQVGYVEGTFRGDYAQNDSDSSIYPWTTLGLMQRIYDSAGSKGQAASSGFESSGSSLFQYFEDCMINDLTVDANATQCPDIQLITENCRYVCYTSVTYKPATTKFSNTNENNTFDDGPNNVIVNSVKSTTTNYATIPDLVFVDKVNVPDDYVLPVAPDPRA